MHGWIILQFINIFNSTSVISGQWKNEALSNKVSFEPVHEKTNKMTCAPSEDSDEPGHLPSLIILPCPREETLGP